MFQDTAPYKLPLPNGNDMSNISACLRNNLCSFQIKSNNIYLILKIH